MNRSDHCSACSGGGLVPAPGCTCYGTAHTCTPTTCAVCHRSGIKKCHQAAERQQRAAGSSNASSNTAALDQTGADHLEHVGADHPNR